MLNSAQKNIYLRVYNWTQALPTSFLFKEISAQNYTLGSSGGIIRPTNQDQVIVVNANIASSPANSFTLYAVFDGMGGMKEGAECARIALSSLIASLVFTPELNIRDRVRSALETANRMVFERFRGEGGTTIAAIITNQFDDTIAFNVGDSRVYAFSPQKYLRQISTDDTLSGALAHLGSNMTSENSNQLIQYLGMGTGLLEPHIIPISRLIENEGYILATDGAYNLPNGTFEAITQHASSSKDIVQRLIKSSEWIGGLDNASVICLWPNNKRSINIPDPQVSTIRLLGIQDSLEIQGQLSQKPDQYEEKISLESLALLPLVAKPAQNDTYSTPKKKEKLLTTAKKKKPKKGSSRKNSPPPQIEIKLVEE